MSYEEFCNIVKYNYKESKLYMPNEIFYDLLENIKSAPHIAFSYAYIYFTMWLYRNAKYFTLGEEIFNNTRIKEILGYNPKQQTLDYIIKKNGLLDTLEYTESTKDYPVSWNYNNEDGLTFLMSSQLDEVSLSYLTKVPKQFFLKKPLKGFYRIDIDEEGEEYEIEGSFYNVSNTHLIHFEVFAYCMTKKEIGCTGFYLYSYLSHRCDIFDGEYDVSLIRLAEETGLSSASLDKYLGLLKSYKMIDFRHNQDFFVVGLDKSERKANTYIVRSFDLFSEKKSSFKKIDIMKREEYQHLLRERENMLTPDKAEIATNELPF